MMPFQFDVLTISLALLITLFVFMGLLVFHYRKLFKDEKVYSGVLTKSLHREKNLVEMERQISERQAEVIEKQDLIIKAIKSNKSLGELVVNISADTTGLSAALNQAKKELGVVGA